MLHKMVGTLYYVQNETLHNDLQIDPVIAVVKKHLTQLMNEGYTATQILERFSYWWTGLIEDLKGVDLALKYGTVINHVS